jgi:hypothetical protein
MLVIRCRHGWHQPMNCVTSIYEAPLLSWYSGTWYMTQRTCHLSSQKLSIRLGNGPPNKSIRLRGSGRAESNDQNLWMVVGG